ncbi:Rrf2 family transcriptional regulator [Naumannella cuiyingiana]|uniref:Rrf2 family protein n=1 Tax=Naumannella cuiyingiana TaxID=1347891 RepID=A0A7Z0DBG6_9ACTN|nr:Rrf2 family protein [Naumannella cuiyingiana]
MRITAKSDYGVRAMIEIARRDADGPINAEEIGTAQDIPRGFLLAILADLRRAGVLLSLRGPSGGWRLARPAAEISVAEVIRSIDGPLVSVHGLRPEAVDYNETATPLQLVWIAARSSLRDVLENVSVGDLAAGELPAPIAGRTVDEDAWQPR